MTPKKNIKKEIVAAAIKILKTEGYDSLTIRNICEMVNCSTTMFYYYFSGKDELVHNAISFNSISHSKEEIDRYKNLPPLEGIIQANLITAQNYEDIDIDLFSKYLDPSNHALNPIYVSALESDGWLSRAYQNHINEAYRRNLFLPGTDPETVRLEINSIYYGIAFSWAMSKGAFPLTNAMRKSIVRHLNTFIREEERFDIDDPRFINY